MYFQAKDEVYISNALGMRQNINKVEVISVFPQTHDIEWFQLITGRNMDLREQSQTKARRRFVV